MVWIIFTAYEAKSPLKNRFGDFSQRDYIFGFY